MQAAWAVSVMSLRATERYISTRGPCPDCRALLCLGAIGVCRAALSKAVLSALLQCVQGPCDHHMWGEAIDTLAPQPLGLLAGLAPWTLVPARPPKLAVQRELSTVVWDGASPGLPLTLTGGKTVTAVPQVHSLSPQHTFCRRCALKSGRCVCASCPDL